MTHTASTSQPWWQLDLGAQANVDSIELANRTDCCTSRLSDFYVLLSNEPFGDKTLGELLSDESIGRIFHAGEPARLSVFSFAGTQARYVRIQRQQAGILSLAEVQVIGSF